MKKQILITLIAILTGSFASYAQENETGMSMQIRPRAEYRNGVLFPREEGNLPAFFINNRARLSMYYKRDNLMLKMSGQHVGVWGEDPQIDRNGRFMLNEAWARINFATYFFAQLGRQSLIYDDERILGGLDWNISGRFHDALKLGFENEQNKIHAILAFNQNEERIIGGTHYATGGQPYKTMQTLWYEYRNNPLSVSALLLNLGQEGGTPQDAKTRYMQTMGANVNYFPESFRVGGTFYYQMGKTAANTDISAWMASVNASYFFTDYIGLKIGSDYLSGDDQQDAKYQAFNPLYGTHHKFYGSMDYFYASAFNNGLNPGLWDNYVGLMFNASSNLNLSLNYHYFMITQDVLVNNEAISKGLGSEIDFQLDWNIMKDVKLSAGYSFMLGTSSMDIVKGGNHKSWQDWAWISININPNILLFKW